MSNQLDMGKGILINEVVIPFTSRIIEMVSETTLTNVPVHSSIDIDTIIAGDEDPKFVNVEVIRARTSGNNNRYGNSVVREINDMIPGVQAFLGHPDPSKYGFEFREPQGIYVGSMLEQLDDGILRSVAKCYLFTTSPLREWVPKSIAAGKPMTVSINGTADVIRNNSYNDVVHMTELGSIDWANPGTEGMFTSQALSVVREQQQILETGGKNNMAEMTAQQIISNATVSEMRSYNLNGCNEIIKATTVQELQSLNPKVVTEIKESATITEMTLNIDGKSQTVKLAELQNTISGYETRLTELQGKYDTEVIKGYKESKINELVPEKLREQVSKRVVGKTKTEIDSSIESEISYIREMGGIDNPPAGNGRKTADATAKEAVYSLFGNKPKDTK